MKILLIDQIAKINYKYTFPLANSLVNNGIEVNLVIDQKNEIENCLCNRIMLFNTDDKKISKFSKACNYITSYWNIMHIIKNKKVDILHTEWYSFSPIDYFFIRIIKHRFNIKYVATVHDILPFNIKVYDNYFYKKLYKLADSIILQAPGNMKRFADLFPQSSHKTKMIPHGNMLEYVEICDKIGSRKRLNLPKDKMILLFFGQIKKIKGVDILLKAMINIHKIYPDAYLVIAGCTWKLDFNDCLDIIEDNNMKKYIRTDIFYIPDEDVKYYYSACDFCVLPYTDVYQSGVIQLSYGYMKAVVATMLPAFTQFVKEGVTGFLAVPGDVQSLTEAIKRAMEEKESLEIMGKLGNEKIKRELNWNVIGKCIIDECYYNLKV